MTRHPRYGWGRAIFVRVPGMMVYCQRQKMFYGFITHHPGHNKGWVTLWSLVARRHTGVAAVKDCGKQRGRVTASPGGVNMATCGGQDGTSRHRLPATRPDSETPFTNLFNTCAGRFNTGKVQIFKFTLQRPHKQELPCCPCLEPSVLGEYQSLLLL